MALPTASDNPFPSLLIVEGTEPSAPSAGRQRLYIDSTTHLLKATNSSGTDRTIEGVPAGAITTSGLTMATARLLGRTTGSTGAVEEITVGSGLSLSAGALTASGGSGLTSQNATLTATDGVALTQNTYTDVISMSCAAGTWLIHAQGTFTSASGAQDCSMRIFDSTNTATLADQSASISGTSFTIGLCIVCLVTLAGTATIKLQGTHTGSNGVTIFRSLANNGNGNLSTQLNAIKVA